MKFTVIIPSRGRVRGLSAVITSLDLLSSGENEISYCIGVDDDDPATRLFATGLQTSMPVAYRTAPRPQSLGALVNSIAECMPADVYCSITDDILCLTPNWDREIVKAVDGLSHGVFWWTNALTEPSLFAIVTEKWRKAAGMIFTEDYPFWFDDWVLAEVWTMATGMEIQRLQIQIADKPKHTHRLRDLAFWQRFYSETRHMRVNWAKAIAKKLGLPEPTFAREVGERLAKILRPITEIEARPIELAQGDTKVKPDPAYLRAKARAEAILENQLKLAA